LRSSMALTESYWPADTSEAVLESTTASALRDAVDAAPERTALVTGVALAPERRRWTYAELLSISEQAARALLTRFEPGEHVAVWANNVPEWVFLEYAAGLAGIVLVTVNPAYRPQELEYVLGQSGAVGLFHVGEFRGNRMAETVASVRPKLPNLREVIDFGDWNEFVAPGAAERPLPTVKPDEAALILYTSGTTGFPKGAVLQHRSITNNARFVAQRWRMRAGSVLLSPVPQFHAAGCVGSTLAAGQSLATMVMIQQFDPGVVLDLIESERADILLGVPTMLVAMEESAGFASRDLSSLRTVQTGGANVPAALVRRYDRLASEGFNTVYGLTESSPIITQTSLDDADEDKFTTVGTPLPQTDVKIIDPDSGTIQPVGVSGELCTRGYHVMKEYFDMPEQTAEALDADGWLHTGDLCSMDERGYVRVTGRLKDMIIRGGENIYPREIEERLFTHPDIVDVAVVGIPDDKWGEQVAAFLRLEPGATVSRDALEAFVREQLAAYKAPRIWVQMDEFPLTGPGKVQKFRLREMFEQGEVEENL
jgi:fatty-acyl-CoA synthase